MTLKQLQSALPLKAAVIAVQCFNELCPIGTQVEWPMCGIKAKTTTVGFIKNGIIPTVCLDIGNGLNVPIEQLRMMKEFVVETSTE